MSRPVYFTGPTGAIGSQMPPGPLALATRLERGVDEMAAELASPSAALIHLAGMTGVEACERDPGRARALNVNGSRKWFEAAGRTKCAHFVYVSSSHVFAAPAYGERLTADSPLGPQTVYARTKLEAELALLEAGPRFPAMKLTIARVFGVRSPKLRPGFLWTRLTEQARAGDYRPIAGLRCVRDYMDAAEVCRVLLRLATTLTAPDVVLVCSGRPITVRELAERAFEEHGLDPSRIEEAPPRPYDAPYLVGVPTAF